MTNGHNGSVGVAFPSGNRLDLLIDQIGILTELVTTGFSELKNGLSEIKIIAQSQQQDINRLVEVTDKLVDTTARQQQDITRQQQDINRLVEVTDRQAETVAKQAQTVDRLALLLERVLVDRGQNN
jgi:ABC-type transporter Mla subunit MlaD